MSELPPALSAAQQFTPEFWEQQRRDMTKVKIERITKLADDFTEFVFDNGQAFQRRNTELNMDIDLHANQQVFVQTVKNTLVTGMFVPEQGWVFQMSAQDLADYAKKLSSMIHRQRMSAREGLREFMADALRMGLEQQAVDLTEAATGDLIVGGTINLSELAGFVMAAMESFDPRSSANA